jgi:hypothetical protein
MVTSFTGVGSDHCLSHNWLYCVVVAQYEEASHLTFSFNVSILLCIHVLPSVPIADNLQLLRSFFDILQTKWHGGTIYLCCIPECVNITNTLKRVSMWFSSGSFSC